MHDIQSGDKNTLHLMKRDWTKIFEYSIYGDLKVYSCDSKDISLRDSSHYAIIIHGGLCFDSCEKQGDKG